MVIKLYKSSSDPRVVSKSLFDEISYNSATARDAFDIMGGSIVIATNSDLSGYNYAHVDDVNRYYYIKDITILREGVWQLELAIDVLMTYADKIRSLHGTVDRQTNLNNGYISDPEYKALTFSQIVTKTFPNEMTNDTIILMTIG